MDYNKVFMRSWNTVLKQYQEGKIRFLSEADLQSHLFSESLKLFANEQFEIPYKIHAEKSILSPHQKTDLVLGDNEVAVEIKLEADYPGVNKPVVFREDVEKDIVRLDEYLKKGMKDAHFVMIDEDGQHARNPRIREEWKSIVTQGRRCYYLHVTRP